MHHADTFQAICEYVREMRGIDANTFYNFTGKSARKREIVDCRKLAVYCGAEYFKTTGMAGWSIMAKILQMSHATVMYYAKAIEDLTSVDKHLKSQILAECKQVMKVSLVDEARRQGANRLLDSLIQEVKNTADRAGFKCEVILTVKELEIDYFPE